MADMKAAVDDMLEVSRALEDDDAPPTVAFGVGAYMRCIACEEVVLLPDSRCVIWARKHVSCK